MLRRLANLALLPLAVVLIVQNLPALRVDARRAALALGLASVGAFLNFAGLIMPTFPGRTLVRGLGCVVLVVLAAGLAFTGWTVGQERIAPEAKADPEVLEALRVAAARLWWLAIGVAYVGVSLLPLPPRRPVGPTSA